MQAGHKNGREARMTGSDGSRISGFFIGPAFLALAALMFFTSTDNTIPTEVTPAIRPVSISTEPMRTPMADPPSAVVNGLEHRCDDCHGILQSRENSQDDLRQHTNITLSHGLNNNCYNCHHRDEREMLVIHDGSSIPYADSDLLCAQCHGRMYRDWSRGAHGKTLGAWDPSSPLYERLSCVQCHDPHAPMFQQIEPLPGPRTLRMGVQGNGHHADVMAKRNPLLQWSKRGEQGRDHDDGGHD
ncbi:MAG: hypothetical protein K8E66_13525 [Phycisphaerales bacterium]|nr:hypothetical protein [Phycisphaerales bacterium]